MITLKFHQKFSVKGNVIHLIEKEMLDPLRKNAMTRLTLTRKTDLKKFMTLNKLIVNGS